MRNSLSAFVRGFFAAVLALTLTSAPAHVARAAQDPKSQPADSKQEKKAEKKKPEAQSSTAAEPVDIEKEKRTVKRVLRSLQDGFEGKSPRRVTELIDSTIFYDFPRFEDQVTKFLEQSGEMRMYFRESTAEVKGDKATLIVDADMTFSSKTNPSAEQKRRERIQFDFVKTSKGWKIYEISPRTFFTL
jgi:hypothetical protein